MKSLKKTARIAGVMYLGNIITGIFAQVVRSTLIVPGDAGATAKNIMASEWLFRIGFVSDLIMVTFYLLMGLVFYVLLKPVNKNVALLMLLLNLAGVPMLGINMLNQFATLLLMSGAGYLTVFSADQLHALGMLFFNLHEYGYSIAVISWGFYLLPLGYLVFKSGYLPRILGVLLMLAGFCDLIQFFQIFLFPSYEVITYPGLAVALIAEFSFCLWLLIKGAKIPEMKSENGSIL
jgi:nitrate reductase NapE component